MAEAPRAVFLSYASQDAKAARRICDTLLAAGVEVWFDLSELRGGDAWDQKIRRQIKDCELFIPLISRNTQARKEGYFRLEWRLADQRTHLMAQSRTFLLPVCIDDTKDAEAEVPDSFMAIQWTRLPDGETSGEFVARVIRLLQPDQSGGATPAAPRRPPPLPAADGSVPATARKPAASPALIGGVVAVIAALGAGYFVLNRSPASKPGTDASVKQAGAPAVAVAPKVIPEKSIAVLPFVELSERKDKEYFTDGLTEELLDLLAKVPDLVVPARTSTFFFKGKQTTIAEIGKALGVAHVLEGSVQAAGKRVRVAIRLVRADTGARLWSETYDRNLDDVFKLQDEIANAVVSALKVKLLDGALKARAAPKNLDAYNLYLQGRFFAELHTKEGLGKAIDFFNKAISMDPAYEPNWSSLAFAYSDAAGRGLMPPDKAVPKSRETAAKALTLDPKSARAHVALGLIHMNYDGDYQNADREFKEALASEPGNATVLVAAGYLDLVLGRTEAAANLFQQAVTRDPLKASSYSNLGVTYYSEGKFPEAEAAFRKSLEIKPRAVYTHNGLGLVLLSRGQAQAALEEMRQEPDDTWRLQGLAIINQALGKKAEADAALAELREKFGKDAPYAVATVYAYRGDTEAAFEWLDKALAEKDSTITSIKADPLLRPLVKDRRYSALLQKLKLPV